MTPRSSHRTLWRPILWPQVIGLATVLGCAASPAPSEPPTPARESAPEPEPESERAAEVDSCAGVELGEIVARASADADAARRETYELHAASLDLALACAGDSADAELARTAAELQLELIERAVGRLPLASGEPQTRSCKTNSEGVCVYTTTKRKGRPESREADPLAPIPYSEGEQLQLAALRAFEAHARPDDALRERRYQHIGLRMDHNDFAAAWPLLTSYIADYDGHPSSVWAALMALDVLTIAMTRTADEDSAEALLAWMEEIQGRALWTRDDALELRTRIPTLQAGAMWRRGEFAFKRGRDAAEARRSADPNDGEAPPNPDEHFVRCADTFVEIYNTFEDHDRADTLLWIAADCYDAAHEVGKAIQMRRALIARYPESEHYRDTLMYLADGERAVAWYVGAGAHYLEFAEAFAKDDRAPGALLSALEIADGLGDTSAIANIEARYVAYYERKDVKKAGHFVWSRRPQDPSELLAYAQAWIKRFHRKGGQGSWFEAERSVLELRWAASCRQRLDDGLCVARGEPRPSSACTLSGQPPAQLRPRDKRRAKEAADQLARAQAIRTMPAKLAWDEQELAPRLQASVAFHTLEPELEAYLAASPGAHDAEARAEALDRGYAEVAAIGDLGFALRAHGRRGRIWEHLANAGLVRRDGECVPSTPHAEQLAARTAQAYRDCLELGQQAQYFDDAVRRCEDALAVLEPENTPPLAEFVGEPGRVVSSGVASVGLAADPGC